VINLRENHFSDARSFQLFPKALHHRGSYIHLIATVMMGTENCGQTGFFICQQSAILINRWLLCVSYQNKNIKISLFSVMII